MRKKLTKSRDNVVITGTLGGIAEYFNIDPTIIRIIYVVLIFFGYGTPIPLYFVMAMIIPRAPRNEQSKRKPSGFYENLYDQGQPYYNRNQTKQNPPRKEAEKVDDDTDQWSDF